MNIKMTIPQAVSKLLKSDRFQEDARTDPKLRVFKRRFLDGVNGGAGNGAVIKVLTDYGYKIEVIDPKRHP